MTDVPTRRIRLGDCLEEVTRGVGPSWSHYRVLGATRSGLAPAKEPVGQAPNRYKPVEPGTIFYNPMRILLGSIAHLGEGEQPGITSPDYVVFKTSHGVLHPRWFYYWLRSDDGAAFIRTLTRGAVRERMLFRRLATGEIDVPPFSAQTSFAEHIHSVERAQAAAQAQIDFAKTVSAAETREVFEGPRAEKWVWRPLREVLAEPLKTGISRPYSPGSTRYCLTLSSVRDGWIDTTECKPVAVTEAEAEGNSVRPAVFYVVRGNGNRHLVGRGGLARATSASLLYPDLLIQVVPKSELLDTSFLQVAWDNPRTRADLEARARTSAGIFKINQENLREVIIPSPSLNEQKQIAAALRQRLEAARQLRDATERQLRDLEALPAALLRQAFSRVL